MKDAMDPEIEIMPFGRQMEGLPHEPEQQPRVWPHFEERGPTHVHDFHRLARTIAPPTDVYDCACGARRRYLKDAVGPDALLPEPPPGPQCALDWTWIERRGNHTLAMSEGRPY